MKGAGQGPDDARGGEGIVGVGGTEHRGGPRFPGDPEWMAGGRRGEGMHGPPLANATDGGERHGTSPLEGALGPPCPWGGFGNNEGSEVDPTVKGGVWWFKQSPGVLALLPPPSLAAGQWSLGSTGPLAPGLTSPPPQTSVGSVTLPPPPRAPSGLITSCEGRDRERGDGRWEGRRGGRPVGPGDGKG